MSTVTQGGFKLGHLLNKQSCSGFSVPLCDVIWLLHMQISHVEKTTRVSQTATYLTEIKEIC